MQTQHLTSMTPVAGGWKVDCLCGWVELVTGRENATQLKKRAKQVGWDHRAASQISSEESGE